MFELPNNKISELYILKPGTQSFLYFQLDKT